MEKYGTTRKGSRLYMTDNELLTSYRQAADPISQILVLAELNAMEEVEMREYLLSIGAVIDLSVYKKRTRGYKKQSTHVGGNQYTKRKRAAKGED